MSKRLAFLFLAAAACGGPRAAAPVANHVAPPRRASSEPALLGPYTSIDAYCATLPADSCVPADVALDTGHDVAPFAAVTPFTVLAQGPDRACAVGLELGTQWWI